MVIEKLILKVRNEMKDHLILHTWNKKMIKLAGEKLTPVQWLIGLRSNGLHQELQLSDRYGGISCSATISDERKGFGFADIHYSHPYRQSRVYIPVTDAQEADIFADACEMADLFEGWILYNSDKFVDEVKDRKYMFGENNIKYDTAGVSLSHITKHRIWNPSNERVWCNESCGQLLQNRWSDVLGEHLPHELTPDETEYLVRQYFDMKARK
jgi:hypothetical protein